MITKEYLDYIQHVEPITEELLESVFSQAKNANVDKVQKAYEANIKTARRFLKDHGINVAYIEGQAKKAATVAKRQYSRNMPADKVALQIVNTIGKQTLNKVLKGRKAVDAPPVDTPEDTTGTKIIKSIGLFCIVLFANTFLTMLAGAFLGIGGFNINMIGPIVAIVIAPLVEEYSKKISIEGKYQWIYTGIFSGIEALMYIVRMVAAGGSFPGALIIRLVAVGMHFGTTAIQTHYQKKAIETGDKSKALTGYMIAVGVHSVYNFVGVLLNETITDMIGL